MAYVLGYIFADGNVSKNDNRVRISSIDIDILEAINILVCEQNLIRQESNMNGQWYTLTIPSQEIQQDLMNLGVTPNKSLTCTYPQVPHQYQHDFVRGYFDGNGCVSARRHKDSAIPTISTEIATGSECFKDGIIKALEHLTDMAHSFAVNHRKTSRTILIRASSTVSERFYNWIYYNNCICLMRKRNKYDALIAERQQNRRIKPSSAHVV